MIPSHNGKDIRLALSILVQGSQHILIPEEMVPISMPKN